MLTIRVETSQVLSPEQIRTFLEASDAVGFEGRHREEVYDWVNRMLDQLRYTELAKAERGLVRRYVRKMTGLSRAQTTRLIGQYLRGEAVRVKPYRRHHFTARYQRTDIELLCAVDEAHDLLSGPATQKILQREFHDYGDRRYERLAEISVAHLYRLRRSGVYRRERIDYQGTRPSAVSIGERRAPRPEGKPGHLRVDTVHQGDLDGAKGVYHINAVDEVTQWQVVGATSQISEAYLIPVLEAILEQFPFRVIGFHSDNGSEFINHRVAKLLEKLLIEQTKSRPRHSNDNGLAESKNGAVIRKHMGYHYIASHHATAIQAFYQEQLNPYLNFHRPCGVPELEVDGKGKSRRVYRWYATPWEILRQLPELPRYLKSDVIAAELEQQAQRKSDTAAAREMQAAKRKLFGSFLQTRPA